MTSRKGERESLCTDFRIGLNGKIVAVRFSRLQGGPRMGSTTSSFDLIDRIKQGDRGAFTPLFEKFRPRLAVLVHYRLGPELRSRLEVDDILQETLLKAFTQLIHFEYRGPGSFLHWLSLIAEHVIVDQARHEGRAKRHAGEMLRLKSPSNPDGVEPANTLTPSRLLALDESLRRLYQKLDALPEQYREVILLSKIECLSTGEVAARLGKTREAIALMLHRALKHLRQASDSEARS